jgi:hypothetical protein
MGRKKEKPVKYRNERSEPVVSLRDKGSVVIDPALRHALISVVRSRACHDPALISPCMLNALIAFLIGQRGEANSRIASERSISSTPSGLPRLPRSC